MFFHFLGVLLIKVSTRIAQRETLGVCIPARLEQQPDVVGPLTIRDVLLSYE